MANSGCTPTSAACHYSVPTSTAQTCLARDCTGQTSKGLRSAAQSLRIATRPVQIFEVLISGNALFIELKLV